MNDMRILILPLLASALAAADPVGLWRFGVGSVDGQAARIGTLVLTGQEVVASDAAPLRLVCHEAPGITAVIAAGSRGRFTIEPDATGGRQLVFDLEAGAVQLDVTDKAPYSGVRVRGAALDVRVTGTLFVVERTRRDADYVALVRGTVRVGLRPEVARALGRAGELELLERQGVAGDTTAGVGTPTGLEARPQIAFAAGLRTAVADQGSGASPQGTGWDVDLAADLTGAGLEGSGLDEVAGEAGGVPFNELAEDLADSFSELGSAPESITDQVSENASAPAGGSLPLPPPPPPQ
jgi:hypothetical protein